MAPNLQQFARLVVKAKLLSTEELQAAYRDWRTAEPEHRGEVAAFVKYLVRNGRLSAEQVAELLKQSPAEPEYDVELVAVRDPRRGLDRRDLFMILGGALAGAGAIAIPALIIRGCQ